MVIGFVINLAALVFASAFLERHIERILQTSAFRETLGTAAAFWEVPQPRKQWTVIIGGNLPADHDPHLRLSYSAFNSFIRINDALRGLYGDRVQVTLKHVSEIADWNAVAGENLIILGGIFNIPGLPSLTRLLGIPFEQRSLPDRTVYIAVHGPYAEPPRLETLKDGPWVNMDHALIVRLIDYQRGSALLIFAGGESVGTEAAVTSMLDPDLTKSREFDFSYSLNCTVATVDELQKGKMTPEVSRIILSHTKATRLAPETISAVRQFMRNGRLNVGAAPPPKS